MPPKDAFAIMREAARAKQKQASGDAAPAESSAAAGKASGSTSTAAPSSAPPAAADIFTHFKGSGLGSGPKHVADESMQPWVERYRPKKLDNVAAQEHTVSVLKKTLESANLPHMLFYGPPGTGKTSTILALCKQLFGPELYKSRVLELNASDERGISVVREKVKNFAKAAVTKNHDPNYPAPPYKIIILDEADSMTYDAQSALRRIMETHSRITRFCLICNYVTRIIEPITSRCSKFRFKPLDTSSTEARLREICQAENVECPDEALAALIKSSDGDLRRAITYLQSASRLHASSGEPISATSVQEIAGVVPDHAMLKVIRALGIESSSELDSAGAAHDDVDMRDVTGSGNASKSAFEIVQDAVTLVVREGYSATQVLSQLHDLTILDPLVSPKAKAAIALCLGETDKSLNDGADEELQLLTCCFRIRKAVTNVK